METGFWVEQERCVWKLLLLHPPPKALESKTSYLIRLAEANGLQSVDELGELAGGARLGLQCPDYPTPIWTSLAQMTNVPVARWLDMTFFHLVGRFGRTLHSNAVNRFLAGSIAPFLRYCPLCLVEHIPTHYSLLWRFLVLPGCMEHGIRILDHCGHCQSPLPLWQNPPQLTNCPTCQGDLRTCKPASLSNDDREPTVIRTNDLKMLLTRGPRPLEKEHIKLVGRRFQLLRQQRDFWIPEIAHLLGRNPSVIHDIDYVSRYRQATLNDYMQYADVLGYSLCEIFDEQSLHDLAVPPTEEQLLDQVETAIRQLKARGKPVRPGSVGDLIGMTTSQLKHYPRVREILSKCETQRKRELFQLDPQFEEDLVKRLESMLKQLEERSEPIVLQHLCDLVGESYPSLVTKYPRVRALFREYWKNRETHKLPPRLSEEEKVRQVRAAIDLLISQREAVTFMRIRQITKLTQKQLKYTPSVKALIAQYIEKWQEEAS